MTTTQHTTGRERLLQAFDANLRLDAVVDLATLVASDAFETRLDGAAEDLFDCLIDTYPVHASAVMLAEAAKDYDGERGVLGDVLRERDLLGLAVQFSTPVMTRTSKTSWSFSWGYTKSTWVYAETYDKAWELGIAWAERCLKDAKPAPKARHKSAATGAQHA